MALLLHGRDRPRRLVRRARRALDEAASREQPVGAAVARLAPADPALDGAPRACWERLSFGLLVLVFLAALLGEPSQGANLAPTFVFVIFWVGMVPLVVVFGNVWRVLNPWRAAADGVAWLAERLGVRWEPLARVPGTPGTLAGGGAPVRLHRVRAGLPRRVRAALARAGDPDLQLDHLGGRGRLRARRVVRERRRVHGLLRLPLADRAVRRRASGRGGGRSSSGRRSRR